MKHKRKYQPKDRKTRLDGSKYSKPSRAKRRMKRRSRKGPIQAQHDGQSAMMIHMLRAKSKTIRETGGKLKAKVSKG